MISFYILITPHKKETPTRSSRLIESVAALISYILNYLLSVDNNNFRVVVFFFPLFFLFVSFVVFEKFPAVNTADRNKMEKI